jgi:chemotaxis protein MotA
MGILIGLAILLGCVFGTYVIHGGSIEIILHAAPFELIMIFGAAIGAFVVANGMSGLKHMFAELKVGFSGPKKKKQDYIDLLCLLFTLSKLARTKGIVAVESHIERPEESEIFKHYPGVLHDHFAVHLICDTYRLTLLGVEDSFAIEDAMTVQIKKHHHEALHIPHAIQTMADGLPALGIVAAVLGVIKTMASIDQPPTILGGMIGSALVGTFLGVFLSYGIFGPLAALLTSIHNQDGQYYMIIKDAMVSHVKGLAPQISVEVARGNIPTELQPSFADVETAVSQAKAA